MFGERCIYIIYCVDLNINLYNKSAAAAPWRLQGSLQSLYRHDTTDDLSVLSLISNGAKKVNLS